MSVPARLAAFSAVVVIAFGAAFGVGRAVASDDDRGPVPAPREAPDAGHGDGHGTDHGGGS